MLKHIISSTLLLALITFTQVDAESLVMKDKFDVYKSPTCGCCQKWVDHLQEAGGQAEIHHPKNLHALKKELAIEPQYQSCHTTKSSDGFVFEGHIPIKFVEKFLAEKPKDSIGLAAPGMPLGSPGMESGNRFMPYQVLLLKTDGSSEVYADIQTLQDQY